MFEPWRVKHYEPIFRRGSVTDFRYVFKITIRQRHYRGYRRAWYNLKGKYYAKEGDTLSIVAKHFDTNRIHKEGRFPTLQAYEPNTA